MGATHGGNNSDEVLNDLLGREIAESLKQAVEAILDGGVGELGEYVRPDDVTNFAATVPPILTSEIFRHLDSDVAEVIFPLGQTQFGPCCYEDLAQHLLGNHAQLRFAKAQYPGFQIMDFLEVIMMEGGFSRGDHDGGRS